MDRKTVASVFRRAISSGARQIGPFEAEWDISGNCLLPVRREISARKMRDAVIERIVLPDDWATSDFPYDWLGHRRVYKITEKDGPFAVYLTARCRLCDNCLKKRRDMWAARALVEQSRSARTWFGTLTLSPQWHSVFGSHAALRAMQRDREPLEALPFDKQLHYRADAIGVEITKLFKRMRKAGHEFRYMLVLEAHKSGLPHFHILVHEIGAPIGKRDLEAAWRFGFSSWKLATDRRAVWYVAKYLGKSGAARVRASLRYGSLGSALAVGAPLAAARV